MGHLIFDFDKTFIRIHTGGAQHKTQLTEEIIVGNLSAKEAFVQIAKMRQSEDHISFATKGDEKEARKYIANKLKQNPEDYVMGERLVRTYCEAILPEQVVEKIAIQAFDADNKNTHIEKLIQQTGDKNIVLFDDDIWNIVAAWAAGYPAITINNFSPNNSLEKVLKDYLAEPNVEILIRKYIASTYDSLSTAEIMLHSEKPTDKQTYEILIKQARKNFLNQYSDLITRPEAHRECVKLGCIAGTQKLLDNGVINIQSLQYNQDPQFLVEVYKALNQPKPKSELFIYGITRALPGIFDDFETHLPILLANTENAENIMAALNQRIHPAPHYPSIDASKCKEVSVKIMEHIQTHFDRFNKNQQALLIKAIIMGNSYPHFSSLKASILPDEVESLIPLAIGNPVIDENIFKDLLILLEQNVNKIDIAKKALISAMAKGNQTIISILRNQYPIELDETAIFNLLDQTESPKIAEIILNNIQPILPRYIFALAYKASMLELCKKIFLKHSFSPDMVYENECLLEFLLKPKKLNRTTYYFQPFEKCLSFVLFLIEQGASVTEDIFKLCVQNFHHEIIHSVYAKLNTQPDPKVSLAALFDNQSSYSRAETLYALIKSIPSLDLEMAIDDQGNTLAHLATSHNDSNLLKLLFDFGTNLNLPNNAGETPFILLCKNKGEINYELEDNDRPKEESDFEVNSLAKLFFKRNLFNMYHIDHSGHTALLHSIASKDLYLCEYLLIQGSDPTQTTDLGNAFSYLETIYQSKPNSKKKHKFERALTHASKNLKQTPSSTRSIAPTSPLRQFSWIANQNNNATFNPFEILKHSLEDNKFNELSNILNAYPRLLEGQSCSTRLLFLQKAIEHKNYRAIRLLLEHGVKQDLKNEAVIFIMLPFIQSKKMSSVLPILELLLLEGANCHLENSLVYQSILSTRDDNQSLKTLLDKCKPSVLGKHSRDDMHEDESMKQLKLEQLKV